MSTPSDQGDIKVRILDAATRLFAANGFNGTSVQAIAEAVGIRKPSLLYHYSSKAELRDRVLELLLQRWQLDLPRVLAAARAEDRLQSGLEAMLDFFVAKPARAQLIIREMLDRPEAMRALLRQHLQPWTGLLTDYIRAGQQADRVYADLDPEAYVQQIVTMGIGTVAVSDVTRAMIAGAEDQSLKQRLAELIRIARAALYRPRTQHEEGPDGQLLRGQ